MKDFEEIAHTGGKITFSNTGTKYEHCNPHTIVMYDIAVSMNGIILGRAPLGSNLDFLPQPYIRVMMASDKEGFFGYKCPNCSKRFRGKLSETIICPYCLYIGHEVGYFTENQIQYIKLYLNKLSELNQTGKEIVMDLDAIIAELDHNIINLNAYEERQQQFITCPKCNTKFDVIGVYASCPKCAFRNSLSVFLNNSKEKFGKIGGSNEDENTILNRIVEDYSGLGNDVKMVLETIVPLTAANKKKIKKIDFQKIIVTNEILFEIFGLKLFSEDVNNKEFFSLMFQKRHIIAHNSAVVDQDYLDKAKDVSVRLGQQIKIESDELKKFINLLQNETKKFFDQFEELFADWLSKYYEMALTYRK